MRFYLSLMLLLVTSSAFAAPLSTRGNAIKIYDSQNPYVAQVILVVPQFYPLDLVDETDEFYKVTDFQGRQGWIEKNAVASTSAVVVKVSNCNVRTGPGTSNDIIFRANQGVTFKVLEQNNDWIKVVHESGRQGWIYRGMVWGEG